MLLIHEGIGDRSMWDRQWERWRERFTLIRYDQRGFGDSDDPAGEYSLHGDALSVLDAAGAERAAIVGASMGGAAALDLTLAAPDRVWALVAVVATPSGWAHSAEHMAQLRRGRGRLRARRARGRERGRAAHVGRRRRPRSRGTSTPPSAPRSRA